MKVHLISGSTIRNYIHQYRGSRTGFKIWLEKLKKADWTAPSDMLNSFNDADLLGKGSKRVIFNIGGNKYRMICACNFGARKVHLFICWIGTHAEYDEICKRNLQYVIWTYK